MIKHIGGLTGLNLIKLMQTGVSIHPTVKIELSSGGFEISELSKLKLDGVFTPGGTNPFNFCNQVYTPCLRQQN